eukprot:3430173-Prymnesium_polylepis.1
MARPSLIWQDHLRLPQVDVALHLRLEDHALEPLLEPRDVGERAQQELGLVLRGRGAGRARRGATVGNSGRAAQHTRAAWRAHARARARGIQRWGGIERCADPRKLRRRGKGQRVHTLAASLLEAADWLAA